MRAYRLGLYEKSMPNGLSLSEKLRLTRESGYDYLELSVDETEEKLARLAWDGVQLRAAVDAMEEAGVPIASLCLSGHRKYPLGHPDPAVAARSLDILARAVDLAGGLGVRVIQLAGYDVYYEESTPQTRAQFGRSLRRCVELAARAGVILAFETMETPFLDTVEKAMAWVEQERSPYLQVYPDAGNLTNAALKYGGDVLDDLETGRGHLAALHLKEARPGAYREVPYGQGCVDFAAVTGKGLELGVRMFVAEFWHTGRDTWRDDLAGNCRYLRCFLDQSPAE